MLKDTKLPLPVQSQDIVLQLFVSESRGLFEPVSYVCP